MSAQNPSLGVPGSPEGAEEHTGPRDAEVPVPARDALVQQVADTITWNIEITHPDGEWEARRVDNWDADEQDAYRSNGGFAEGNAAVQAVRRRKVAEAVLALLESGTAGVYLARDSELPDVRAELRARSQACARLTAEVERLRGLVAAADEFGDRHVIDLRDDGWTIAHPLSCRASGLFACPVGASADGLAAPPQVGRFEVTVEGGQLVIGPSIDEICRKERLA